VQKVRGKIMKEENLREIIRESIHRGTELNMEVRLTGPEFENEVDRMIARFEKSGIIKKTYIDGGK
jgi:hypothetical protein